MKTNAMSATLTYNGQAFPVMVEHVQTEHMGAPVEMLSDAGHCGRRYIVRGGRHSGMMRVTIIGLISPPPLIELPFTKRDRFTLAELLPKSNEAEFHDEDPNDWD